MSLTIETTPEVEERLRRMAELYGMSAAQYAQMVLEQSLAPPKKRREDLTDEERAEARARLKRHFGKAHSGDPTSGDNEKIDADLAREYGSTHEENA